MMHRIAADLRLGLLGFCAALLAFPAALQAAPVPGSRILVASDGDVIATYIKSGSIFFNDLYLETPANGLGIIFESDDCMELLPGDPRLATCSTGTPDGTQVNLGFFTAGTELVFRLEALDVPGDPFPSFTYQWFSGDGSQNSDGLAHALVIDTGGNTAYVGFDDTPFNGDENFADMQFMLSNVSVVPLPAALPLLAGGLGLLVPIARRRRAAALG